MINKKEYNVQIWQYNICHINIILIKDMIILENAREKKKQLVVGNIIKQVEIAKMSSSIHLNSKYKQAINNANINIVRNLKLIGVKKYKKHIDQIKKEVNILYRDWILALVTFVKHSLRTHNNKKVTENMKFKQKVDPK